MTEPTQPPPQDQPDDFGEASWEPEPLFAMDPTVTNVQDPVPETEPTAVPEPTAGPQPLAEDLHEPAVEQRPRWVLGVVAGLTALLMLLTGFLAYRVADSRGPAPAEQTRKAALNAGRDAARLVFSYDYRKLDKDFQAALATTTGDFRKDYETTSTKLVLPVAPRYKAILVAEVSEAAVIRELSENEVLVLVFLNVQSTSSLTTAPKITPRRLKMTMQRKGDRWLVSGVDSF